jgi:phosphoglycolate phosphatase
MPSPIVNILFDLDGTLTDPRAGIVACFKHALDGLGRCSLADLDLHSCIGPPLRESFASLLRGEGQEKINAAVALYRQRFSAKGIFENRVYPGIHSALAQLKDLGAALYVATSKPYIFAERIVDHFGLTSCFRAVTGSELGGTRYNKVELVAHILREETLSARSTFMVGDRAHGVVGTLASGVVPVGALWGYGSREELSAAGATIFCERPELLPAVISLLR